jgi:hypothetical protein
MPKKLVTPSDELKISDLPGGWRIYRHPPTPADSPLWVCVKIMAPGRRRRMGQLRAFWLYWGVDARRFRRSRHLFRFVDEQPAVAAAAERALAQLITPDLVELEIGTARMAVERARLLASRARRDEHDRARLEAAHAAALKENVAWGRRTP